MQIDRGLPAKDSGSCSHPTANGLLITLYNIQSSQPTPKFPLKYACIYEDTAESSNFMYIDLKLKTPAKVVSISHTKVQTQDIWSYMLQDPGTFVNFCHHKGSANQNIDNGKTLTMAIQSGYNHNRYRGYLCWRHDATEQTLFKIYLFLKNYLFSHGEKNDGPSPTLVTEFSDIQYLKF